jgi:hypothetical protein
VEETRLLYLYGIVPAAALDAEELHGVDGEEVWLIRSSRVAGIVSAVSAADYSEAALDARLTDLAWVGERGVAHERVLNWFSDHGPVIPLTPFSLHQDETRVRERLESMGDRCDNVLGQLAGCREWAVRIWRTSVVAERLEEQSPRLRLLADEIATAAPGRQYLLAKKLDSLRAEELRRISAEVVKQSFAALSPTGTAAKRLSLPAVASSASERTLLLHGVFLVRQEQFPAFQEQLSKLVDRFQPTGFEWEFTGPWPPYHFVEL